MNLNSGHLPTIILGGNCTSIVNIGYDIPAGSQGIVVIPKRRKYNFEKTANKTAMSGATIKVTNGSQEILGLCKTLGYQIVNVLTQRIKIPNPKYFIGSGKVNEISEYISDTSGLELAVFDCLLKPNQIFNLENKLGVRVLDRNALILMIFLHHARTKEAKLQVEYAILQHQIPYITELVRRSKLGEHPGLLAGGEYKVDEYFRLTKTRIKKIRYELEKIKISRSQRRKNRRRKGFRLITITGYTNAGKSALLRTLTDAQVQIDERMFSTVSPKTRRYRNSNMLFTDTVGFIQNIPTQLIEAFKSTLEEITDADHILLVVDISEDIQIIKNKILTSIEIMDQLMIERSTQAKKITKSNNPYGLSNFVFEEEDFKNPKFHLVLNKIDLIEDPELITRTIIQNLSDELSSHGISKIFRISCQTKLGIDDMITDLNKLEFNNHNL